MVASGEPWQLVTTLNEWGENSAIEPAQEWGSTYVEVLASYPTPSRESPGMPRKPPVRGMTFSHGANSLRLV